VNQPSYLRELKELASQWATSRTVIRLKRSLTSPVEATAKLMWSDGLGQLRTRFSGEMRQPLKLAQWLPALLGTTGAQVPPEFLEDATTVYGASTQTLAWIRAQLPGYPSIQAPQLARGAHRTTNEFSFRIPWRHEEFALGLQTAPYNLKIPQVLEVSDSIAFSDAVVAIQRRLRESDTWKEYAMHRQELVEDDKNQLSESRRRIMQRLSPNEIDAFEPDHLYSRIAHRQQVVAEEIATLSGGAHAFAEAFEDVDRLLEVTCVDILSYLIFFGEPKLVVLTGGLEFRPGPPAATVKFSSDGPGQIGEIIRIEDPLYSGLALISELQLTISKEAGSAVVATAQLIN
jgi:hypothetical protein